MSTQDTFVIVGAGLAGAKAAEALRDQGFEGQIVLLGAEPHRPYERPPLSKGYLAGSAERDTVFVHEPTWYEQHKVDFRPGQAATSIDRSGHRVALADGTDVDYSKLLIATGASSRRLPIEGADASGVHYLRTLDESDALKDVLAQVSRLIVIGAGWIGLEVSAAARQAGVEVTIVESAELPLLRVLGPEVATVFADLHRENGVDFRFGASLMRIMTRDGRATGVELGDGSVIEAEAVLVAVGAAPNVELAQAAGLAVDNGILVDSGLRTSDEDVFAAGDVANAVHPFYGRRIRVEHWANALNQPAVAASVMLGSASEYGDMPYFYTDQYDLGMEYIGYVEPGDYDRVVFRGDVAGREFIAFWVKENRILAGMNVNVWDVVDPIKALIQSRQAIDPARLADAGVPLEDLIGAASAT